MEVLGRLGIADDFEPIDSYADRVDFDQVAATCENATYVFSLLVTSRFATRRMAPRCRDRFRLGNTPTGAISHAV